MTTCMTIILTGYFTCRWMTVWLLLHPVYLSRQDVLFTMKFWATSRVSLTMEFRSHVLKEGEEENQPECSTDFSLCFTLMHQVSSSLFSSLFSKCNVLSKEKGQNLSRNFLTKANFCNKFLKRVWQQQWRDTHYWTQMKECNWIQISILDSIQVFIVCIDIIPLNDVTKKLTSRHRRDYDR